MRNESREKIRGLDDACLYLRFRSVESFVI